MTRTDLIATGWHAGLDAPFEPHAARGLLPGRVARQDRERCLVLAADSEYDATVSGSLRHNASSRVDYPAVGDWVAIEPWPGEPKATVHAVLPRRTSLARKTNLGETDAQVIAANVDVAFIVGGLDHDFNLRRLERYLTFVNESGADAVIVLSKADLCDPDELERRVAMVDSIALGSPVHALSALHDTGMETIHRYLPAGTTAVLVGSSGAGKSTLTNRLLGEERQATGAVREGDNRGRHTTTRRELLVTPDGAMVIDTPGLRELQLWSDDPDAALGSGFADIEELAGACRFRDCTHVDEPGCAVQAAIEAGDLDAARLGNYEKVQRELAHLARRQDARAMSQESKKWKKYSRIGKEARRRKGNL